MMEFHGNQNFRSKRVLWVRLGWSFLEDGANCRSVLEMSHRPKPIFVYDRRNLEEDKLLLYSMIFRGGNKISS